MPVKGKKSKIKHKIKKESEDVEFVENPQSSKIVQRMATKTLSSAARHSERNGTNMDNEERLADTSQSSLWLSKTKKV